MQKASLFLKFSSKSRFLSIVFSLALGSSASVYAERELQTIGLSELLGLVLEKNHNIAVKNLTTVIEAERYEMARAVFDPVLEASYAYQHIDTAQNAQEFVATGGRSATDQQEGQPDSQQGGQPGSEAEEPPPLLTRPNIFEQRNQVAEVGISKKFVTGTTIELSSSLRELDNSLNRDRPPGLFNPELETYTGITLTQPLLRDFGPKVNKAGLRIARSNGRLADLEWRSTTAAAVGSTIKNFYDVMFTHENMLVQRDAISLARKLLEDNKKRRKEGVISPEEVLIAEAAVLTRKDDALLAETQYVERQNALQLLYKTGEDAEREVRLVPKGELKRSIEISERSELLKMAQQARYDILQAFEIVKQRSDQTLFTKNQVKPRFDLIASAGYNGLAGSPGKSYDAAFDGQAPEWTVGVSLSIPLNRKRAKAGYRVAKHQELQAKIDVSRIKSQISLEIDTVLNRIETDRQRVATAAKGREVTSKIMESEIKRLKQGVSTSYQVLQYQKEYSQARSRELAALADLNKDQIDLWLVSGRLLEKMQIEIENDAAKPASKKRETEKVIPVVSQQPIPPYGEAPQVASSGNEETGTVVNQENKAETSLPQKPGRKQRGPYGRR